MSMSCLLAYGDSQNTWVSLQPHSIDGVFGLVSVMVIGRIGAITGLG